MEPILQVHIRSAGYEERPEVIKDIRFSVGPGELVGLIGPNGAGKSTTIKAILGLLKHRSGTVNFIGGRTQYAYIPERPVVYEQMTLWEHLELAAAAFEIPAREWETRSESLLRRFRMTESKHHLPHSFSKGMQQKMMLMIGFLLRPFLYVVDEPFIGLDPRATKEFLTLLDEERGRGAGVLMSTHALDTAERICDSFVLIDRGVVTAAGNLEEIRAQCGLPAGTLFDCFHRISEEG